MILAVLEDDLWDWWMDLVHLNQEVLVQTVILGMAFSTVYLLVMFSTHWGGRNTLSKAAVFSGLIHLICVGGMIVVAPFLEFSNGRAPATKESEEDDFTLINLVSEDLQDLPMGGNTPLWTTPPESVDIVLAQNDPQHQRPNPLEIPEQPFAPRPPDLTGVPGLLPSLPNAPLETALSELVEQLEPRAPSEIPLEGAEPVTMNVAKGGPVGVPGKPRERTAISMRDVLEIQIQRAFQRGGTDEVQREIDPHSQFASIKTFDDPTAYLKSGSERDFMVRQTSPALAVAPLPELDVPDGTGAKVTATRDRGPSGPSRMVVVQKDDDLMDPNVQQDTTEQGSQSDVAVRPRDPGPASDALADRTPPVPIRSQMVSSTGGPGRALPATYRSRGQDERQKAVLKFGGTAASERAVEDALKWLAANQTAEGYWDASAHGGGQVELSKDGLDTRGAEVRGGIPGSQADSGVTALAVLAFLGAGYTQEDGPYADTVNRAINWLISQQAEDGFLGGKAIYYEKAYCHGMAAYALAEAYGMRGDPALTSPIREPLEKALKYLLDQQHPTDGGWRYRKGETGDMSIFGWNLMALKSAEIAGIPIPESNRNLMVTFLTARGLGRYKGLAGYHPQHGAHIPNPTMTAEALFSKQMLGLHRSNPASQEAMDYLMKELPHRENLNYYYYYYGTLATFQYGGEPWKKWNESLRDMLLDEQRVLGPDKGSWDPKDRWGGYGGRVYSTALNTLALEVYYRFLPLYQMGGLYDEP